MSLSVIRLQWPLLTSSFQICSGLEPERARVHCDARGEHSAHARVRAHVHHYTRYMEPALFEDALEALDALVCGYRRVAA